jgi:hypothetical protein
MAGVFLFQPRSGVSTAFLTDNEAMKYNLSGRWGENSL